MWCRCFCLPNLSSLAPFVIIAGSMNYLSLAHWISLHRPRPLITRRSKWFYVYIVLPPSVKLFFKIEMQGHISFGQPLSCMLTVRQDECMISGAKPLRRNWVSHLAVMQQHSYPNLAKGSCTEVISCQCCQIAPIVVRALFKPASNDSGPLQNLGVLSLKTGSLWNAQAWMS